MNENFSWIRRMSQLGTFVHTRLNGAAAGVDSFGNRYYKSRRSSPELREQRWVIYAGEPEASKVPPEWHLWLHHVTDAPIVEDESRKPWQKPHRMNMTGTEDAYKPVGTYGGYQPWRPSSED